MAEQPPKKIGSLRDRIAAFENKGPAPAPAPAPVPRPKPSGVAWKPRPTSPPPAVEEHADNKGPGMSAADARDSITRGGGGSLRERMAALQGLSGFGGGAPAAPPPRPVSEKPKWKPPPVVSPPVEEAGGEGSGDAQPAGEPQPTSPPADVTQASEGEEAAQAAAEGEEGETQEPDPEEEERQRRAAIAARMARLGGARVGMGGPPIFGRKPDVPPKKISTPKVEEPQEGVAESSAQHEEISPTVQSPPAPAASESHVTEAQDDTGDAKAASTTSLLSADSGSSSAPRSPAMPVPAAPRRAAPPRRKAPKSPSPAAAPAPAVLETETVSESPAPTPLSEEDAKSQELQEDVRKSKEDEAALGLVSPTSVPESRQEVQEHEVEEKQEHMVEEKHEHVPDAEEAAYASALTDALEEQTTEPEHDAEQEDEPPHNEPEAFRTIRDINDEGGVGPVVEVAAEEEDEAARRQRILERMRQQGAFNPFGAPPPAKETSTSPLEPESQSEEALYVSQTPTPAPPPVPSATRPDRRDSAASVRSADSEGHAAVDGNETNVNVNRHRMSTAERENMQTVNEEVYEQPAVEELDAEVRHDDIGDVSHEEDIPHEEAPEPPRRRSSSSYRRASYESDRSAPVPPVAVPMRRDSLRSPPPVASPSPTPTSPSVKRASLPPPRALPTIPQGVADAGPRASSVHRTSISSVNSSTGKQVPIVPREDKAPPVPIRRPSTDSRSSRRSMPPPPPPPLLQQEGEDEGEDADTGYHAPASAPAMPPVPPPHRPSLDVRPERRSIPLPPPPPPPTAPEVPSDNEDEYDERQHGYLTEEYVGHDEAGVESLAYEVEEEEVAPPPPPRRASVRVSQGSVVDHAPMSPVAVSPTRVERPSAPLAPPPAPQADSPPPDAHDDLGEQEVLDDEDGDPIDPAFYGVQRSASSVGPSHGVPVATPTAVEAEEPTAAQESAEDEESTRRRTLAERMAKLGGIRFGAPLPPVARPPPPPPAEISTGEEGLSESESAEHPAEEAPAQEEEEDEAARRQRIAARLASTGGMRFGMMPGVAPPVASPPPVPNQRPPQPDVMATPRAPPVPVARPPPPPPAEEPEPESDYQSVSDGVPVEAEESEMEEVNYEDAEEPPPPPVPTREGRRVTSPVPVSQPQGPPMPPPTSRPPIPMGRPPIPGTPQTVRLSTSPPHMPPPPPPMQNDYVMVEPEAEEDAPPPPPRTTSQRRAAPPSAPPPPPPQAAPQSYAPQASMMSRTSGVAQWENALDFGGDTDLSLSGQWSEDSTQYPPSSQIPPPPPSQVSGRASSSAGHPSSQPHVIPSQLSPDELMQQWGRVGVQIHETATTLYEKSRKSPIGDGTYIGFVAAVIKQIPNAMQPSSFDSFGYLFYEQSGPSVQKRASDIMPGDIIVLQDAKLKGHKGLQPYHQNVGVGQPVCAIVGDFEVKKAKVKVYQANQHVGQESVETVSYRLEDLKSGTVKVYRVLEA